jgi:hypothetical protein
MATFATAALINFRFVLITRLPGSRRLPWLRYVA